MYKFVSGTCKGAAASHLCLLYWTPTMPSLDSVHTNYKREDFLDIYRLIIIMYGPTESIESSDHFKLFMCELCYNMLVQYVAA